MVYPHHRTHFIHPVATGVYNDIGVDVALAGLNGPRVIFMLGQRGDGGITVYFCARFARMIGQCLSQLCRVDVAILAIPKTAQKVIG